MTAMRAAIYARYSSDLQRETSIDDQIAVARDYADRQGWTVADADIYRDRGVSGASLDGRPGIAALLTAAATAPPAFEVVLVDDTSRLARDTADAIRVVQQLTFCGVRVVFISQGLDTASDQAETLVAVHGVVDQLYIRELKHKIRRGLAGQQERGFHTGGRTYGYRTVPVPDSTGRQDANGPVVIGKRLEVDPEQAEVIRQVYLWYVDGVSIPQIVDRLTVDRIPPPPRGPPGRRSTSTASSRTSGISGSRSGGSGRTSADPGTNQMVSRPVPRDQWHVVDREELRIISDELFQQAAERRETQRSFFKIGERQQLARGRSGLYSPRLLVGLTRCGTCGRAISIVAGGHGSPRYGCPNSWRNGLTACDNRLTVRQKIVDPLVLDGLKTELLKPELVDLHHRRRHRGGHQGAERDARPEEGPAEAYRRPSGRSSPGW